MSDLYDQDAEVWADEWADNSDVVPGWSIWEDIEEIELHTVRMHRSILDRLTGGRIGAKYLEI